MSKQITQPQTTEPLIVRENLKIRVMKLNAEFFHYTKTNITQLQIARALRSHQSNISMAFNDPKKVPALARLVEQYLDMHEKKLRVKYQKNASA